MRKPRIMGVFKAPLLLSTMRGMVHCDWLVDISHSAEKGDWRLSRFGKIGRKHDRITWWISHFA